MSAFADALAALHADANMGIEVELRRPPGPWTPLRVLLSQPTDEMAGLGGLGARAGTITATILAADYAPLTTARGDEMRIAATLYRIEVAEADALGLSWRLTLAAVA